jgi:hypothetical protein
MITRDPRDHVGADGVIPLADGERGPLLGRDQLLLFDRERGIVAWRYHIHYRILSPVKLIFAQMPCL